VTTGLQWVLSAITAYFLIALCARSYIEWKWWRRKHQSPLLEMSHVSAEIGHEIQRTPDASMASLSSSIALGEELRHLKDDSPLIRELEQQREELHRQHESLNHEYTSRSAALDAKGGGTQDERYELENFMARVCDKRDELLQLGARIQNERELLRERVAPREAVVRQQIASLDKDFSRKLEIGRRAQAMAGSKLHSILDSQREALTTFRIRFFFEMAFPIVFGALAVLLSVFVTP
jgi:hypothetical protein